jgi:magnesium transporter
MDDRSDIPARGGRRDEFGLDPRFVEEARRRGGGDAAGSTRSSIRCTPPTSPTWSRSARRAARSWRSGGGVDGDILSELEESLREEVIEGLTPGELALAVQDLETDDVVDLVEDLDAEGRSEVLAALPAADRLAVEKALAYPNTRPAA